ncbi:hypothetical protein NL108_016508 [Boleophthalmus pectinirostris]|nr:hypothetical protein NL108_016508 [Boleophthalmus pectinirostris]
MHAALIFQPTPPSEKRKIVEDTRVKILRAQDRFREFPSDVLATKVDQDNSVLLQVKKQQEQERAERLHVCDYMGGRLPQQEAVTRYQLEREKKIQHQKQDCEYRFGVLAPREPLDLLDRGRRKFPEVDRGEGMHAALTFQPTPPSEKRKIVEDTRMKILRTQGRFKEFPSDVLATKVDQDNSVLLQVKKQQEQERAERLHVCEYNGGKTPTTRSSHQVPAGERKEDTAPKAGCY